MPTFRTLVAILSLFAFVVFVWYLTPYVSFAGLYPLESVTARLVFILVMIGASVAAWLRRTAPKRLRISWAAANAPNTTPGPDTPPAERPIVFISYRRSDTEDAAGRLHDRLVDAFGAQRVFMDIDSVPLGVDFVDHVAEQISRCTAVIVMIGRQWLTIEDSSGRKRLHLSDDLLRAEIAAALQHGVPVIPVFVQEATMPRAEDLPDNIRALTRRNGISLSATHWRTDVERLIKELDRVMRV